MRPLQLLLTVALGAPLAPLAPLASGGGFDPRHVAADADWVFHVDFEALTRSTLLGSLHRQGIKMENEFDLDHFGAKFGVDPLADLHSITMYGIGGVGVVTVVAGKRKIESAWTRLAAEAIRSRVAGLECIALGRARDTRLVLLLPARPGAPRLAVIATTTQAAERACLVLGGEAPGLDSVAAREGARPVDRGSDDASAPLRARPSDGALIFAANVPGRTLLHSPQAEPFLRRGLSLLCELADIERSAKDAFAAAVRALEFELSERYGEFTLKLALEAETAAAADELERVLHARLAPWVSADLPDGRQAPLSRLLAGLQITATARRLTVLYRGDARAFVADLLQVEAGAK